MISFGHGMIRDHVWRPPQAHNDRQAVGPVTDRPCHYMSCRRSRAEHARGVSGRLAGRWA